MRVPRIRGGTEKKEIPLQPQFFCSFLVKKFLKMDVFSIKSAEGAEFFLGFENREGGYLGAGERGSWEGVGGVTRPS